MVNYEWIAQYHSGSSFQAIALIQKGSDIKPVPVSIITGFLGSGKTTFLNNLLLSITDREFAVVINEIGHTSLDHLLVDVCQDQVIDLPGGCICCTSSNALVETFSNLLQQKYDGIFDFNHLIIETSGITNTAVMIENLWADSIVRENYSLSAITCMISAMDWSASPEPEAIAQLAICDNIIVTKPELISNSKRATRLARIESEVEHYNPTAQIYYTPFNSVQFTKILYEAKPNINFSASASRKIPHLENSYSTFTLRDHQCVDISRIDQFLDLLLSKYGKNILRIKGMFFQQQSPERPLIVQGVKTVLSPHTYLQNWTDKPQSFLTIIHNGADQYAIEELFGSMFAHANSDRADAQATIDNPLKIIGM